MHGLLVTLEELLALRQAVCHSHPPQSRMVSNSERFGNYRSSFRGRGISFVENRMYQPGDDIRAINWAVTARTGKPYTKVYQQERERSVYLVLDFSASMFFGTRQAFKSVVAAYAAAMLAWTYLQEGDRVGAVLIKDTVQILPPCRSKQSLIELLKNIVKFSAVSSRGVDVSNGLRKLKPLIKSGSLLYFLSDFYCLNEELQNEWRYFAKKHEVINLLIYDQLERDPPKKGRYLFYDPETLQSVAFDVNKSFSCQYKAIFAERWLSLKKMCFTLNMHLAELATHQDIANVLKRLLNRQV